MRVPISEIQKRASHLPGFASILIAAAMWSSSADAAVFYVKTNGTDTFTGASWAEAKRSVTNTVAAAAAGDQIWIGSGTYRERVILKNGVGLYGGFAGTETAFDQRNLGLNIAVLDAQSKGTVITIPTSSGTNTVVDGLTITGGSGITGGGISVVASAPKIMNNLITHNTVTGGTGGGIYVLGFLVVSNAQPFIFNNTIFQNTAVGGNSDGAGIALGGCSPLVAYNRVLGNLAARFAGGIGCWKDSHALLLGNVIEGNFAGGEVVVGLGGGVFATASDFDGKIVANAVSAPLLVDNLIVANGAPAGGGMGFVDSTLGAATLLNNTILGNTGSGIAWGNTAPTNYNNLVAYNSAGLERIDTSPVTLRNNDVFGNNVLAERTDYIGLPEATGVNGNISAEPELANYPIGDCHLQPTSPCVNAGLNSVLLPGLLDLDGNPRALGAAVDIGAYESTGVNWNVPTPVIHVSPAGSNGDGLTWATAKRTVAGGIRAAAVLAQSGGALIPRGAEVWVAAGLYPEHISIPAFVYLYGGFAGTETSRGARNIQLHPTVLDGGWHPTIILSQGAGYLLSALDGFTVQNGGTFTGGRTPGVTFNGYGAAINCTLSAPIIANNLIRSNSIGSPFNTLSLSSGGGISGYFSHAQILSNTFVRNEVLEKISGGGGAIYAAQSKPTIAGNVFQQNEARQGTAIFVNVGSARIVHNLVQTNSFYADGLTYLGASDGAILLVACTHFLIDGNIIEGNQANFGAGIDLKGSEDGRVQNNLVLGNVASDLQSGLGWGGGIYCEIDGQTVPGNIAIVNNTVAGNTAPGPAGSDQGGGISLTLVATNLVLANNIVAFNSGGIYLKPGSSTPGVFGKNCVNNPINYTFIAPGSGDINLDPQFVNRAAANYHLLPASPCIDAGNIAGSAPPALDLDETARPLDGNNDGTPAVDIGAYEFIHPNADTDHDGMLDASELIAGTNPTDPASKLIVAGHLSPPGNVLTLDWLSVPGRLYDLQFSPSVIGPWQALSNGLAGTGARLSVQDPISGGGSRIYRLEVRKQ